MELIQEYVVTAVMAVCLCVGAILKHLLPEVNNRYIPLILGSMGVVMNCWYTGTLDVQVALGGLSSGLSATGMFEMVRNVLPPKTGV